MFSSTSSRETIETLRKTKLFPSGAYNKCNVYYDDLYASNDKTHNIKYLKSIK
jgi:hypothetical protein